MLWRKYSTLPNADGLAQKQILFFKTIIDHEILSCQWHFGYNVRKIALQHGLKPYLDTKVMNPIQKTMRLINSCPILPERVLPKFYDYLESEGSPIIQSSKPPPPGVLVMIWHYSLLPYINENACYTKMYKICSFQNKSWDEGQATQCAEDCAAHLHRRGFTIVYQALSRGWYGWPLKVSFLWIYCKFQI